LLNKLKKVKIYLLIPKGVYMYQNTNQSLKQRHYPQKESKTTTDIEQ
jgi:hypothetical protein